MADVVSPIKRSRMMSGIKGKNSRPEMLVRKALFAMGHRFRLHRRDLPGTPDIVMPGRRIAIFVHGCFWHAHQGCKYAKVPSTRTEFWAAKLQGNVNRDQRDVNQLVELDWRVLTVWECSTRDAEVAAGLSSALWQWIESDARLGVISAQVLRALKSDTCGAQARKSSNRRTQDS